MGTFFIDAFKIKRADSGTGMRFSGTPVAVNAAGTFKMHRFVTAPPAQVVTLSTGVVDSPLNAGAINGQVAQPLSFVSLLSTGGIADGTTDNITAFAAACSQAAATTHKTVFIPQGTFAYSGNLTASGVVVEGIGPTSILLAQNPSARAIFLKGSSAGIKSVLLQNSATAWAASNTSIDYAGVVVGSSASDFLVHNVYIDEVAGFGVVTEQSAGPGVILQNTISGCKASSVRLRKEAHDILVKLNFANRPGGPMGVQAATADAARVDDVTFSYNWIKDVSGTAASVAILGAHHARVHNNLMQSNSSHAGLVIAQDGATGPFANLSCTAEYNTIENCGRSANNTAALLVYNTTATAHTIIVRRNDLVQANGEPGIRAFGPHTATTLDNNRITGANTQYVDAATAGITTVLFAGGNAGYPHTTPGLGESPHNTTIPPVSEIVDSGLNTWTVVGGVVHRNGVATISSSVNLLLYWNRRVYQNTVNGWWVWDDNSTASNKWTVTTDPRVIATTAPAITTTRHPVDFLQVGNPATGTYWIDDNRWGSQGISEGSTQGLSSGPAADGFPTRILAGYWEAYQAFNQSYVRIQNVDQRYNVIYLFHCQFQNGEAGNGTPIFPWISPSEVTAAQVQQVRGRGQKVILSIGGAGHRYIFQTRTQSNNFIAGFKNIVSALGGVDGCDFNNYEQKTLNQTFFNEMIFIAQQLKAFYGEPFAITTPAAPTKTGGPPVNGISMDVPDDLNFVSALHAASVLTWCAPQYYDWSFFKQDGTISQVNQQWTARIPANKVAIGLGAGNYNVANATTLAEANREWDRCIASNPNQRGVFSWNTNFDAQQGYAFASNFHNKFSAMGAPVVSEGASTSTFMQRVERQLTAGPEGQVAFRVQWRWPTSVNGVLVDGNPNFSEVKSYPSIIYGARPGYRSTSRWPAFEKAVRLPDGVVVTAAPADAPLIVSNNWERSGGSVSTVAPSGGTPGTNLPKQLLISAGALIMTGRMSSSATGKAHIVTDIWLQAPANPTQTAGFVNSPITHEIMIPLRNFGGYGAHGNRASNQRHSHDVVIDGVTYHVYHYDVSGNGALRYNFGSLNPNYTDEETGTGRTGWKFIVFQHDGTAHPLLADGSFRLDLGKFVNHLRTRVDSRGIAWVQGTEHFVSVELGVEPVVGEGDMIVWDYKVA